MTGYWTVRTRKLQGHALPLPDPGAKAWQPSSAMRRYENAVHERLAARRFVLLVPGVLVVWERTPWRIVAVEERPDDLWGDKYEQQYADAVATWERWKRGDKPERHTWRARPVAIQIVPVSDPNADPLHLIAPGNHPWSVLPEHYSVCVACGELPPCRHEIAEQEADLIAARNDVAMDIPPGYCLGCGEHITHRQEAVRFPGPNLWRLDMPDNTAVFHARRECSGEVERYRRQWAARGGEDPQTAISFDDSEETL